MSRVRVMKERLKGLGGYIERSMFVRFRLLKHLIEISMNENRYVAGYADIGREPSDWNIPNV